MTRISFELHLATESIVAARTGDKFVGGGSQKIEVE